MKKFFNSYAFLVHPRNISDVYRKYPFARIIPNKLLEFWCLVWPPVTVVRMYFQKDKENTVEGILISLPMTARQMIEKRSMARKRIYQAIKKAEKLGASVISLGALTSSLSGGGKIYDGKFKINITSGHAYTAHTVTSYVFRVIKDFKFDNNVRIGIVGAAGSVGSTCAQVLVDKNYNNLVLVDLESKLKKLSGIKKKLKKHHLRITHKINEIKDCDIVIAATNAPEALIKPGDLKYGAIVVDDAQPSDISPEVARQRDDVMIIDAGVLTAPGIKLNFNFGLAKKENIFSCMAEALIFASIGKYYKYEIMNVSSELINKIGEHGKDLGFRIDDYQRFGEIYSNKKIEKLKLINSNN